jgi:hypothetical protein
MSVGARTAADALQVASKPIALSALALVQRDRLQLDAPVNDMLTS